MLLADFYAISLLMALLYFVDGERIKCIDDSYEVIILLLLLGI